VGGFTAKDIAWAVENCPPQLVAVIVLVTLTALLTWRVNVVVSKALSQEQEQSKKIQALEKQQHKLIQLISSAPCVTKNNGLWLQDPGRNGGQPAEPIKCKYEEAKRKVEP